MTPGPFHTNPLGVRRTGDDDTRPSSCRRRERRAIAASWFVAGCAVGFIGAVLADNVLPDRAPAEASPADFKIIAGEAP